MRKDALQNYAPSPRIPLPDYSGHRRAWRHPQRSARSLATGRLQAERRHPKIGRWILLAAAIAAAAALKGATC